MNWIFLALFLCLFFSKYSYMKQKHCECSVEKMWKHLLIESNSSSRVSTNFHQTRSKLKIFTQNFQSSIFFGAFRIFPQNKWLIRVQEIMEYKPWTFCKKTHELSNNIPHLTIWLIPIKLFKEILGTSKSKKILHWKSQNYIYSKRNWNQFKSAIKNQSIY